MSEPLEILSGPLDVYIAPVGEAFPTVSTSPPGGNWTLLGSNGDLNYGEDGVTVAHEESVEEFRMLGSTGPVKAVRSEESLMVRLLLADLSPAQYKYALNFNTVTSNASDDEIDTYKGREVATRALLVRGPSPVFDGGNAQWEVPRVHVGGEPEIVFQKGEPAGIEIEFRALIDLNAASDAKRFGVFRVQTS